MNDADPRDARVDRYLRDLPGALPPAGLGDRIVDRHLARRARRNGLPLAAACLLAAVLLWQQVGQNPVPTGEAPRRVEAQALVEVRSVDRRLQAAFRGGASADELDALWRARREALAQLEAAPAAGERRQVRL